MKHKHLHILLLVLGTVIAVLTRIWNLSAAVDEMGLFISGHPATTALAAVGILFVLAFLASALRSPGRGEDHRVMTYSAGQAATALVAGAFLLAGSLMNLLRGLTMENLIIAILGIAAAICMMLLYRPRKEGRQTPGMELVPVIFLLVKLILNFKYWSTDPLILDYCVMLFALIFTLLAFYGIAGFAFDRGKPRRTLCYASCGILFAAMAVADGILSSDPGTALTYGGFVLWLVPAALCLLAPHAVPPKQEPGEKL